MRIQFADKAAREKEIDLKKLHSESMRFPTKLNREKRGAYRQVIASKATESFKTCCIRNNAKGF